MHARTPVLLAQGRVRRPSPSRTTRAASSPDPERGGRPKQTRRLQSPRLRVQCATRSAWHGSRLGARAHGMGMGWDARSCARALAPALRCAAAAMFARAGDRRSNAQLPKGRAGGRGAGNSVPPARTAAGRCRQQCLLPCGHEQPLPTNTHKGLMIGDNPGRKFNPPQRHSACAHQKCSGIRTPEVRITTPPVSHTHLSPPSLWADCFNGRTVKEVHSIQQDMCANNARRVVCTQGCSLVCYALLLCRKQARNRGHHSYLGACLRFNCS